MAVPRPSLPDTGTPAANGAGAQKADGARFAESRTGNCGRPRSLVYAHLGSTPTERLKELDLTTSSVSQHEAGWGLLYELVSRWSWSSVGIDPLHVNNPIMAS